MDIDFSTSDSPMGAFVKLDLGEAVYLFIFFPHFYSRKGYVDQ